MKTLNKGDTETYGCNLWEILLMDSIFTVAWYQQSGISNQFKQAWSTDWY